MVNVIATQMALGRAPWVVPRRATRLALKRAFYELSFRISCCLGISSLSLYRHVKTVKAE